MIDYDKEVSTITDILKALDKFDNKDEIVNAIKGSLYDIETDWHTEDILREDYTIVYLKGVEDGKQMFKDKENLVKWKLLELTVSKKNEQVISEIEKILDGKYE